MKYYRVRYNDIAVSYLPELDGGGTTFGQKYLDVVRDKLGHVEHAFEFCAGPGFIGFSMLAHGLCDRLTLADVNPEAVRACEATIRENGLQDRVKVYLSDCLDGIPASEKWDLVVSNPPHWDGTEARYREAIRLVDPGFQIHRRFYASVGRHLKPGGSIIFQENAHATREEAFVPMIEANGLRCVEVFGAARRGVIEPSPARTVLDEVSQRVLNRVFWPVERALMTPRIERFFKDNDLYRKLSALPGLAPTQFYFIWSKAHEASASASAGRSGGHRAVAGDA